MTQLQQQKLTWKQWALIIFGRWLTGWPLIRRPRSDWTWLHGAPRDPVSWRKPQLDRWPGWWRMIVRYCTTVMLILAVLWPWQTITVVLVIYVGIVAYLVSLRCTVCRGGALRIRWRRADR
jgi:hypothetical protein